MSDFDPGERSTEMPQHLASSTSEEERIFLSFIQGIHSSQSFAEKNLLFSNAAVKIVSHMLQGKEEVLPDDLRIETAAGNKGGAIRISERLSSKADFQKMWSTTSCRSILGKMARMTLQQ